MASSVNLGKVMITPKGEYDPEVQYEKLDLVIYDGSGYICVRDTIGLAPDVNDAWMKIVEKGGIGPKGEDGITPTFKIGNVEGVDYGQTPEVSVTKKDNDYALNFKLERGRPGETPEGVALSVNGKLPDDQGAVTLEPSDISAVPETRTVNGKSLESDIIITVEDLGIDPEATGTVKSVNSKSPDEEGNVDISYEDVGAKPANYEPDLSSYVQNTRTINGHDLSSDIFLTAEEVGAKPASYAPDLSGYVPTSRTINNKALTDNVSLTAADVGAVATNATIAVDHGGTGATTAAAARTNLGLTFALSGTVLTITVK